MIAIQIEGLGKMYKLFNKTSDRVADVFGINKMKFWNKEPKFQEFWSLRDINLTVQKGERVGIIGRNGAGKSTLLKLITGTIQATEGCVQVNGNIQALMQLGTGFHPEFTGVENIRTALAYSGVSRKRAHALESEIIEFSELEDYINQPVKFYSAGMYSRLAFAVSTALKPDILIIDEVLGAGDAAFTAKCAERMKLLTRESGATVLFVSHSMESVLEICERAILIEKGFVVADGSALEISKIYNKKIREEEEIRLRAKEYRVSKNDMNSIISGDESSSVILFHFCTNKAHPDYKHKIYSVKLCDRNTVLAEIKIGAPMDNDRQNTSRVIEGARFMDWGKSSKDGRGFFRFYCDQNGVNYHAPFQLSFPKYLHAGDLSICVNADCDGSEPVYLEQFSHGEYHRLCELPKGYETITVPLWTETSMDEKEPTVEDEKPEEILLSVEEKQTDITPPPLEIQNTVTPEEPEQEQKELLFEEFEKSNSIYGSQQAVISKVDIFDSKNQSKRVFTMGESVNFRLWISPQCVLQRFTLVVDILTKSGKVVTQVFCDSEQLGIENIDKNFEISASLSPMRLGADEYMVSVGLFRTCDYSKEAEEEAYCVVDRAIFFTVRQDEMVKKSMGAFAQACMWDYQGTQFLFDATDMQLKVNG